MSIIICSVMLVLNIVLWIFCIRLIRRELSVKGTIDEVKKEVNKLISEINQETDRDITLMESKCNKIKNLIDSADKKILMYENTFIQKENEKTLLKQLSDFDSQNEGKQKKSSGRNSSSNLYSDYMPLFTEFAGTEETNPSLAKNKNVKAYPKQENLDFRKKDESEILTKKDKTVESAVVKEKEPVSGMPEILKSSVKIEPKVPVTEQILKLAGEGFTPELIAGKLNISVSEVSMTMDLYM